MRSAVRAIVINNDQLLVVHRNKFGEEYDILPGGNIELAESPEAALLRELAEETQVQISNPRLIFLEHAGEPYGDQYIYLCDYVSGEPALHPLSEEMAIHKLGKNLYEPLWRPIAELPAMPFVSERLKQAILNGIASGWPTFQTELG